MKDKLELLRKVITVEGLTKAREIACSIDFSEIQDLNLLDGLARIFVKLGLIEKAIEAWEKALEVASEEGNASASERCLVNLIKFSPNNPAYYIRLGEVYESLGEKEKAYETYKLGHENTGHERLKALMRLTQSRKAPGEKEKLELAKTILHLFAGREGVFAKQWVSPEGKTGYSPVKRDLRTFDIIKHLEGKLTIGVYVVRRNNTVKFIVFDIDIGKHISREPALPGTKAYRKTLDVALKLKRLLGSKGIPSYIEYSGFKGMHVWIFLKKSVKASIAYNFCRRILSDLEVPFDISVEFFPKQKQVDEEGFGNLVKLPLGKHQKSGIFSRFVDDSGCEIKNTLDFLRNIRKADTETITAISQSTDYSEENIPASSSEEFNLYADEEFVRVINNCTVLKELVDKALSGAKLNKEEISIIIYTLGNLTNGDKIVNTIFERNGKVPQEHMLKSRLKGYPTSCSKIRKKLGLPENHCRCEFPGVPRYSTPLNFAVTPNNTLSQDIQAVVMEYIQLKEQMGRLKERLEQLEGEIVRFFESTGTSELRTSAGTFKMLKENGRRTFVLEV